MKKTNKPRQRSSPLIREILDNTAPVELEKSRMRMRIAARIDDILQARGMTKIELARAMGKQPSEVTKWLSGTHNYTVDTLTEIAFQLGVTIEDLCRKSPPASTVHHIRVVMKYPAKAITRPYAFTTGEPAIAYHAKARNVIHVPESAYYA
jgi:transcriptional regulator with XRE-family HTH domain